MNNDIRNAMSVFCIRISLQLILTVFELRRLVTFSMFPFRVAVRKSIRSVIWKIRMNDNFDLKAKSKKFHLKGQSNDQFFYQAYRLSFRHSDLYFLNYLAKILLDFSLSHIIFLQFPIISKAYLIEVAKPLFFSLMAAFLEFNSSYVTFIQ